MGPCGHHSVIHNHHDGDAAKCPPGDKWVTKLWDTHAREHDSAIKNEVLPLATAWMDLEGIT